MRIHTQSQVPFICWHEELLEAHSHFFDLSVGLFHGLVHFLLLFVDLLAGEVVALSMELLEFLLGGGIFSGDQGAEAGLDSDVLLSIFDFDVQLLFKNFSGTRLGCPPAALTRHVTDRSVRLERQIWLGSHSG